jgi:uncharacterized protein
MNCTEARDLLNAYTDGELEVTKTVALEAHVAACGRCRGALAALQAVRSAVGRNCELEQAPGSLHAAVRSGMAGAGRRSRWTWLRSPAAIAAPGLAALVLAVWLAVAGIGQQPATPAGQMRVVYHISSSDTASAAMRNLSNHLQAMPNVRVVVVAHNNGVDFLLKGARDEANRPFEEIVKRFAAQGVDFRVCYNTLERRSIGAGEVIGAATVVPSGIAEIGRLQSREGYVYLRL